MSNTPPPHTTADLLWQEYQQLQAQAPEFLHPPKAASKLAVSELAILTLLAHYKPASCLALKPDMPTLLKPVDLWLRLFAVARNDFGVHLHVLHARSHLTSSYLTLHDQLHQVIYQTGDTRYAFLLQEHSQSRGHSLSLNLFTEQGQAHAKIYLLSQRGQTRAIPYLQKWRQDPPLHLLRRPTVPPAQQASGNTNLALFLQQALCTLPNNTDCRIELSSRWVHGRYQGKLLRTQPEAHYVHVQDPEFQAHWDTNAAQSLYLDHHDEQTCLSAYSAQGDGLHIQIKGDTAASWYRKLLKHKTSHAAFIA